MMVKNFIFIINILILFSCIKNKDTKQDYENFDNFIVKFFAIEDFQKERTIFPVEYSYYEDYPDKIKIVEINEENWKPLKDTTLVKSHYLRKIYDRFEHKYNNTGQRVFSYIGNETGTEIYYYFLLKDKKWYHFKRENFSD